ncbi:hypothetical protein [Dongshaea marina]|uniref:hypothetical protein n=1 Tax=Dongshaea marina TaxID=2047966 RepID=UPI000D3E065D|nr:hypothetical protein [Dongshaea marina]
MDHPTKVALLSLVSRLRKSQKPSKRKSIEECFDLIDEAITYGASISMISNLMSEHGVTISEGYLRNAMYRIRRDTGKQKFKKSPNKTTLKEIQEKPQDKEESEGERIAKPYKEKIERYQELKKNHASMDDRYTALGGNLDDLNGLNEREKRKRCINLMLKITDHIEKVERAIR